MSRFFLSLVSIFFVLSVSAPSNAQVVKPCADFLKISDFSKTNQDIAQVHKQISEDISYIRTQILEEDSLIRVKWMARHISQAVLIHDSNEKALKIAILTALLRQNIDLRVLDNCI